MEVLEYIKENPIADYATLKIRSGIDNKFFDYNIKNLEDQTMLLDLLDKTSKSFFNLEKAFVSFLETGETKFNITKNKVDWVYDEKFNYTIKCKVNFNVGDSYMGFYRLANNEINSINNFIKASDVYSMPIYTTFAKNAIADTVNHLKTVVEDLNTALLKKDEYLDQVYNDFKTQLIDVFFEAVSVRSNGLIDSNTLRDRINATLTNVTEGEVKDGFYDKLDKARNNFINMNKDFIDSFLNNTEVDEQNVDEIKTSKEFFEDGSDKLHQGLRNTIIVTEKNESMEDDLNNSDTTEPDIN